MRFRGEASSRRPRRRPRRPGSASSQVGLANVGGESILDHVAMPLLARGTAPETARARALLQLERVGAAGMRAPAAARARADRARARRDRASARDGAEAAARRRPDAPRRPARARGGPAARALDRRRRRRRADDDRRSDGRLRRRPRADDQRRRPARRGERRERANVVPLRAARTAARSGAEASSPGVASRRRRRSTTSSDVRRAAERGGGLASGAVRSPRSPPRAVGEVQARDAREQDRVCARGRRAQVGGRGRRAISDQRKPVGGVARSSRSGPT